MPSLLNTQTTTSPRNAQASWVEIRELIVALLFVQLTANASLLARALGPRMMLAVFVGFTVVVYCGAISGQQFAARRVVGWVNAPWHYWALAAVSGPMLAITVTAITVAFGHPIRLMEPFPNQVLADAGSYRRGDLPTRRIPASP